MEVEDSTRERAPLLSAPPGESTRNDSKFYSVGNVNYGSAGAGRQLASQDEEKGVAIGPSRANAKRAKRSSRLHMTGGGVVLLLIPLLHCCSYGVLIFALHK